MKIKSGYQREILKDDQGTLHYAEVLFGFLKTKKWQYLTVCLFF